MSEFSKIGEVVKEHPTSILLGAVGLIVLLYLMRSGKGAVSNDIAPNVATIMRDNIQSQTQLNALGVQEQTQIRLAQISAPIAIQEINEKALESNNAVAMSNNWDKLSAGALNAMNNANYQTGLMNNLFGLFGLGANRGWWSGGSGGGSGSSFVGSGYGADTTLGGIEAGYGGDEAGFAMAAGA